MQVQSPETPTTLVQCPNLPDESRQRAKPTGGAPDPVTVREVVMVMVDGLVPKVSPGSVPSMVNVPLLKCNFVAGLDVPIPTLPPDTAKSEPLTDNPFPITVKVLVIVSCP